MPEIGEVARVVHFLRIHLVGKTIKKIIAPDDANIFGKVGCSGPAFQKALEGKKIVSAGRQGKYFWLELNEGPHPLFHFGMTGWLHIKDQQTFYYKRSTPPPQSEWPPRFTKFELETVEEPGSPVVHAAFTDPRRFARIRLIDCLGSEIRNTTPLKENGPDPTVDKDVLTLEWLTELMGRRKVPVKALLLDQANISGIGNWVGDEIMYHARLHPEQYSHTFTTSQLQTLYTSLMHICDTAVGVLSDASKFPKEWLFQHRWGKGKKDAAMELPTGEKIAFLTVGGRTSCIVPSLQKKTGPVKKEVEEGDFVENDEIDEGEPKKKKKQSSKAAAKKTSKKKTEDDVKDEEDVEVSTKSMPANNGSKKRKAKSKSVTKKEDTEEEEDAIASPPAKKSKKAKRSSTPVDSTSVPRMEDSGRRRSARLKKEDD